MSRQTANSSETETYTNSDSIHGDITRSTRRSALKSLGIGVLGVGTVPVASADKKVTVVTGRSGSEPVARETVPRRWYEHAKAARRVKSNLSRRYAANDAVVDVAIGRGDSKIGRLWKNTVEVDVQRGAASSLSLPDSAEGVAVNTNAVDRTDNEIELQFCNNMGDYDGIVGGVETRAIQDGDNTLDSTATMCCPVTKGSTQYALVANHMFLPDKSQCDGNWDKRLYQDDANDYIGQVERYNEELDYALVKPYDPTMTIQNRVVGESWADGSIVGHATLDGLQIYMSGETPVRKMGVSTGRNSGRIKRLNADFTSGCPSINGEGIRTGAEGAKGDSGGPHYVTTEMDGVLITGMHVGAKGDKTGEKSCTNDGVSGNESPIRPVSISTPAYKMSNIDNLKFG
ncbi:hypothetical protein [Halobaculum sp. MBLA0143]|uniref:hypothetical protein n=1 Tax=Halobaculum sp. MBLA0143 TaxID=3079933 RepID=UPI003524783C